jgi:hypothetical protein
MCHDITVVQIVAWVDSIYSWLTAFGPIHSETPVVKWMYFYRQNGEASLLLNLSYIQIYE